MPCIHYNAERFGKDWGTRLSGRNYINPDWPDIAWAAITVGKMGLSDLFAHGQFSIHDILSRVFTIYANLMADGSFINKSPLYESLDPSEKSGVAYFIGMTSAKLLALYLFHVPWLVHLERIRSIYNIRLAEGGRPDLIGQNRRGDWYIFEAKGRTNSFSRDALNKGKKQARKLRDISGQLPILRAAVHSFFDRNLNIRLCDPEDYDDDAVGLIIKDNEFYGSYYRPFLFLLNYQSREQRIGDNVFLFADEELMGLSFGVNVKLLQLIEGGAGGLREVVSLVPPERIIQTIDNQHVGIYPDGIAIRLNKLWSKDLMQMDPRERKKNMRI